MQLNLKNVAKIKDTTLNIDGITVIAGENNTGKSTVGKALFSIFNSMNNVDEKISHQKKDSIYSAINSSLINYPIDDEQNTIDEILKQQMIFSRSLTDSIMKHLQNLNNQSIDDFIKDFISNWEFLKNTNDLSNFINEVVTKLNTIINVSNEKVMREIITRFFNRSFENQISPLTDENVQSEINLTIKNKNLTCQFESNRCTYSSSEFNILHQAFYIDNPFIIDYMSTGFLTTTTKNTDSHLLEHLRKQKSNIFEGIFDTVIAKDRLDNIFNMLKKVVDGEIISTSDSEYYLKSQSFNKPINIKNLSTGLKSFTLIKRLLENGSLKEKDVLILDEPEIHLHPEWQLTYAELIVLLQKEFDLTMVITTHSPYFLDAIDIFSSKYGISHKVNYYLAENDGAVSYLHDVTNNIDAIYKKLSDPMQKLENIRNGLI